MISTVNAHSKLHVILTGLKIGILGSSKVTVKLTEFLNKVTCNIKRNLIKLYENLTDAEDLLIFEE